MSDIAKTLKTTKKAYSEVKFTSNLH
jgi:hypothetical protein